MLELQNGHIVCLNSVLALSAIPGAIDYCTSKASAFAFMESLTLGLLDCPGVSATTVLPFHTSTEMFQGMRVRSVQWTRAEAYCEQRKKQKYENNPEPFGFGFEVCYLILHLQDSGMLCWCRVLLLRSGSSDKVSVLSTNARSGKLSIIQKEQSVGTRATGMNLKGIVLSKRNQ